MGLIREFFNLSWFRIYAVVISLYLLTMFLSQSLINEIVYFNTYSEQLTYDRAVELYNSMKRFAWVGYAFFPLIILVKILSVSMVIYAGVLFSNLHRKVTLGEVIRVVTGSEIVFILAGIVKVLWFCFFAGNYTLKDISFFYPLSLINLFGPDEVNYLWIFPLQTINLFNVMYLLLLAYGLRIKGGIEKRQSDTIVAGTYVPALFLWVALVMFLSVKSV